MLKLTLPGFRNSMKTYISLSIFMLLSVGVKAQFDVFIWADSCQNSAVVFSTDVMSQPVDSVSWNFGDPASGVNDTTSTFLPFHVFSDTGLYIVTLIKWVGSVSTTVIDTIRIYPIVNADLGNDTTICQTTPLTFNLQQNYATYLWHDNTTSPAYNVLNSDTISVTVSGVCNIATDTVVVLVDQPFSLNLGPDTNYCRGQEIELSSNLTTGATLLWSTGSSQDRINVTQTGTYFLSAENTCLTQVDSITINFLPIPQGPLLPNDTVNCFNIGFTILRPDNDSITYVWSDSSTTKLFEVDSSQNIWLAAINQCGQFVDTMKVFFNEEIISDLGNDTTICPGDSIALGIGQQGAEYAWNTGQISDTIYTLQSDLNYVVTITLGQCQAISSIRVALSDLVCPSIDCDVYFDNVFTPNNDGINDFWRLTSDCDIYSFDLKIFNRWGQEVFTSSNINFGWDGYVNGELAPSGTYFFTLDYRDQVVVNADRNDVKGVLTLIR